MGLPALVVPSSMVKEIPEILSEAGITFDTKQVISELPVDETPPKFYLLCSTPEKDNVRVTFGRFSGERFPDKIVVVLHPIPSSLLKMFRRSNLLKQIQDTLREHGATDLPDPQKPSQ